MNTDGTPGVNADVTVTIPSGPIRLAAGAILGAGFVTAGLSALLFFVAFRRPTAPVATRRQNRSPSDDPESPRPTVVRRRAEGLAPTRGRSVVASVVQPMSTRTTVTRLPQLVIGLALFGLGSGLMVQSRLGNPPWDVFHEGVSLHTPVTIGVAGIATSFAVLLLWIPLRRAPRDRDPRERGAGRRLHRPDDSPGRPSGGVRGALGAAGDRGRGRRGRFGPLHRRPTRYRSPRRADDRHLPTRPVAPHGENRYRGHRVGCRLAPRRDIGVGTLVFALGIGPLVQLFLPRSTSDRDP